MPLKFDEIQHEWFGGEHLHFDPSDVERAFAIAEKIRGREWVLGQDFGNTPFPGMGRRGGFSEFNRVYWFGKRIQAVIGVPGSDSLLERLSAGDQAADSELTSVYLLRSRCPNTTVEIAPEVVVGDRLRRPDFRIRSTEDFWTYVEVTQLNRSEASTSLLQQLQQFTDQAISIPQPFLLEIVFWREPTQDEADEVLVQARDACQTADGHRIDIGDFASVLVRSGDPAVIVPSILPENDGTRMSLSRSIVGPDQPNRQIVIRVPFADQRAEDILTAKAKQLPSNECGLVMVDVTKQPTAFESWARPIPQRFTPQQHTRVSGVLLFSAAMYLAPQGPIWLTTLKLIPNPHARIPLPVWITDTVDEIRAECRRLTGRPD